LEKCEIRTIAGKKRIANAIIDEIFRLDAFLLVGHQDPDTDCIAALASVALLLRKLQREAVIYLPGPVGEQFNYLLAICKYNGITMRYGDDSIPENIEGIFILDTPKPEMIAMNDAIRALFGDPGIRKIEIDHHLETDAAYAGDEGYCLVSEASSTCEHIGYLCFKLDKMPDRIGNVEMYSRNISLAILTGIVGDSHMGRFLNSNKERRYYRLFSSMFDKLLIEKTNKDSRNIASMEAIFDAIQRFSVQEKQCFDRIIKQKKKSPSICYVSLGREESAELFSQYGAERIVNVSRAAADTLAEESGKLGFVSYYDADPSSDYVQFRLRRSADYKSLDLRTVLGALLIANGGGHPGAIGFRVGKAEVPDIHGYTEQLVAEIERLVAAG
jgi:nanoRNase/pAp phosphatase (c-di-AMP/oligoRNAs hydrolase)